jgi:hypothetical protein
LQEEVDAPLGETLLERVAFLGYPMLRRPYEDIAVLIVIAHLCDLNGGF